MIMGQIGFVLSPAFPLIPKRSAKLRRPFNAKLLQQIWCILQFPFVNAQFTQVFKYNRQFTQNYGRGDKKTGTCYFAATVARPRCRRVKCKWMLSHLHIHFYPALSL